MEKLYFFSLLFYIRKGEQNFVQPVVGTFEALQQAVDAINADDTVTSCVAVYQNTYSADDSAPIVVKQAPKKEEK